MTSWGWSVDFWWWCFSGKQKNPIFMVGIMKHQIKYYTVLHFCTSWWIWFIIRCCTFLDSGSSSSSMNPWWWSPWITRKIHHARYEIMDELMKCATNIKHLISPMFRCPKMLEVRWFRRGVRWRKKRMSDVKVFHWLMVDIWTSLGSSKLLKRDHSIHYWNSYKPLEPVRIQIRAMLLIWNRDFELLPAETFQKRPGHSSNIRLLQTDFWCELQVQNHATVPLEGRVTWCWRECGSLKLTFF